MSKLVKLPCVVIDCKEYLPSLELDEQKVTDIGQTLAFMLLKTGNPPIGFGANLDTAQVFQFFEEHDDAVLAVKFTHRAMETLSKGWTAGQEAIKKALKERVRRGAPMWGDMFEVDDDQDDDQDDPIPEGMLP